MTTNHANIILCPEWYQLGFAHSIQRTWFHGTATIVGLRFLQNNFALFKKSLETNRITSANIVFFDSIYQPLKHSIDTIRSLVSTHYTIKCITHTITDHLNQQISTDTTVDFTPYIQQQHSLPIIPSLWEKTNKLRKKQFPNLKPKVFPMLCSKGIGKDISWLKKTSKYPFEAIPIFWHSKVVDCISSQGVVGIVSDKDNHDLLRKFWNSYGILVLEDDTLDNLSYPAHGVDFSTLLSNKHNLIASSRSNIDWKPDFDKEASEWSSHFATVTPSNWITATPTDLGKIHKSQQETIRVNNIKDAKLVKEGDKVARLPLPTIEEDKLPCVSVCTLTRNHRTVFPFCVNSLHNQSYPLHKIEWIILQNGDEPIDDLIPKTLIRKLKRFHIETLPSDHGLTLGELRNRAVAASTEQIVSFMDDDDIYFHTSILARVKAMIKYNVDCTGCNLIGTYNLLQNKGGIASDGKDLFSEASMLFKRSFWEERGFNTKEKTGEAHGFLLGRQSRCISIPYHFVILAITHAINTTGTLRLIDGKELIPLKQLLTEKELSLVETTSKYLQQRYRIVHKEPSSKH